jgi:hypothetical protein
MDKLHIFRSSHLQQAVSAQVWIFVQGCISAPSSLFGVFRSCCLSSNHRLGQRARPHRQRPMNKIQLMITPRSRSVPVGTPSKRAASSSWWPWLEGLRRTIERSEVSDARTPNDRMIRNLNPDFNAIRFQTIIESIQRMTPKGCPLVALAQ